MHVAPEVFEGDFFYMYILMIHDLGVLIPFIMFEYEVLRTINAAPYNISPNT